MFKYFCLVLLLIILSGCKKESEVEVIPDIKDTVKKKDTTIVVVDTLGVIFEGLYVHNANSNSFRDCANQDSSYWIKDGTKKLNSMYQKFHSPKNIYGVVYAKLRGIKTETTDEKQKEKYPQTLVVKEIMEVQKKNFRNTCIPYEFWGLGNEPNWSLQISKQENMIEFFDLAGGKEYYFFYEEEITEDGMTVYASHNNIQRNTIKIYIKNEPCSDTMSDTQHEYSVEVILNGNRKFRGCGIKGKN